MRERAPESRAEIRFDEASFERFVSELHGQEVALEGVNNVQTSVGLVAHPPERGLRL